MNYSTDDATTGNELYAYDPAAQTFTLIKDINAGPGNSGISNFVQLGNEVYFEAMNNVWKTDGTTSGTLEVSSIANQNITNVANFFVWNGELYFEGDNGGGVSNDELWKYNPNTDLVTQISNTSGNNDDHDPNDFVVVNSPLLPMEILAYSGEPGADDDSRLFSTNGIMTFQLTNQFIDVSEIFYWPAQELVLFRAEELDANGDDIDGLELYAYDLNTLSTDNQTLDNVVIYPNPVKNTIFIQSNSNFEQYSIYNLQGQSVQNGTLQSKTIETNLSSGVYILNLSSAGRVTQKKIIIQ
jgi:ELWxxDGT repeat protein